MYFARCVSGITSVGLNAVALVNPNAVRNAAVPLRSSAEADRLERKAAADSDHSRASNEHADNYMLAVVLFALALFFAGISTKLETSRARTVILGLGCVLFVGTVIWIATFPVHATI